MKAIILSAGQGSRLLPLTAESPKCTLRIEGKTLIEWQIDALRENAVDEIVVVTGYKADKVHDLLDKRYGKGAVDVAFNPFFEVADNLASCWMVREHFAGDFLLINGDTLFEPAVAQQLLSSGQHPITLARDHKLHYDEDDMKLILDDERLLSIGKKLPLEQVDGESIGMIRFDSEGARIFRATIERCMQEPVALERWYLSVIDQIANETRAVWTASVEGLDWAEVDYPLDLKHAESMIAAWNWGTEYWGDAKAIHTGTR